MNCRELCEMLKGMIAEERRLTNEILKTINEVMDKRAFLELGYATMFDWLTKGCGYSNGAAQRRIEAARLLRVVPEAATKLETGDISLSTLAKAQTAIRAQERATGKKVTPEFKKQIVEKISNKPSLEAERSLFELMPESKKHVFQEKRVLIDAETIRLSMNFTKQMTENLKNLKEIHSHKFPNASDAEIVGFALETLLKQSTSAAETARVKKARMNGTNKAKMGRAEKAKVGCTYKDEKTGKVCGSHYQVQMDHIIPKAKGGSNRPDNLRPLCRQHNLMMAEKHFGKAHMNRFRKLRDRIVPYTLDKSPVKQINSTQQEIDGTSSRARMEKLFALTSPDVCVAEALQEILRLSALRAHHYGHLTHERQKVIRIPRNHPIDEFREIGLDECYRR